MFSAYLNQEIKLTLKQATGVRGKQIPIVLHAELEAYIINELRDVVSWDYPVVIPSTSDAVVTCAMWDKTGHKVVAVGEATKETLPSNVATAYPTTTAANRAFDRAAIRFLGLGRVYSDQEIAPDGPKSYEPDRLVDAPETEPTAVDRDSSETEMAKNDNQATSVAAPKVHSPENVRNEAKGESEENGGSEKITMGAYKNSGATVAEIYATRPEWLVGIIERITPKNPDIVRQWNAIKRYLDYKNHPYEGKGA